MTALQTLRGLISRKWQAWRQRRRWPVSTQLRHLQIMLLQDGRWLAHDKTAAALTERYLNALKPDWYSHHFGDIRQLREDLALCPHQAREHMAARPIDAQTLIQDGWKISACRFAPMYFQWRSPSGISGSDYVSKDIFAIPTAVVEDEKLRRERHQPFLKSSA